MTKEENKDVRDAIDLICEVRTLLRIGTMASGALIDRENEEAMITLFDLAEDQAQKARLLLYRSIGMEAPGGVSA